MGSEKYIYILVLALIAIVATIIKYWKKRDVEITTTPIENTSSSLVINGLSENELSVIFAIEDVLIVDNNYIAMGVVVKGSIKVGDVLNYVDKNLNLGTATIIGMEAFRKSVEVANSGENVGMMVDSTTPLDRGTYLYKQN